MVHSTWGDWFVREEVEATRPDGVSVWYLGCNGFIVRSAEATVYIDPYFGDGDPPTLVRMIPVPIDPADVTLADAVLVTHEHLDHMHPPSYAGLLEAGGTLYAPSAAYESPDYEGDLRVPEAERRTISVGDVVEVGDLTVYVCAAADPDAFEPVSYVIEHDDGTFFHPGDSKPADEFSEIGDRFDIDVGVLAFGSRGLVPFPDEKRVERVAWYMNEDQVIEVANALQLDRLLPSHWDMWKSVTGNPNALVEHAATHEYPRCVEVVQVGDRVDLGRPGIVPMQAMR